MGLHNKGGTGAKEEKEWGREGETGREGKHLLSEEVCDLWKGKKKKDG